MSSMNCATLSTTISESLPVLFDCAPAPREGIRVRTPFMYPDGGIVDVFVVERGGRYEVTDFGEALGWLRMQSVRGRLSDKQRKLIDDVCVTLGVELFRGQLVLRCNGLEEISQAVLRLGQAAVRVTDLWFTFRTRAVETVADEVQDWLKERRIPFQRAVRHPGRSGRTWTIDYQTHTDARTSLVFLLSTGSRAAARRVTEHMVAGCLDLSHLKVTQPNLVFVSLFDDTQDVWQEEDFRMVEDVSEVTWWSKPEEFEAVLRAA